jgi:hypothetical protein
VWFIPSRKQWSTWSLPSKLTAIGTYIGLLSLGLYVIDKTHSSSVHFSRTVKKRTLPVLLSLRNSTERSITIQRRGDFVLWLPQGVDNIRRLSGKYDIETKTKSASTSTIVVKTKSTENVFAKLQAMYSLDEFLDRGAADLEFIFRSDNSGILFSGSIPFTRQKIETVRWEIDLSTKQ